jgi:hypothetical protein
MTIEQSKLFSLLFRVKPPIKNKNTNWMAKFKWSILQYLSSITGRGSKYIYRQKMSLKHYEITLKKFKFSNSQIKKIKNLIKKFTKVFEENIKEITYVNPKTPVGFKNHVGFSLETDLKGVIQSNSIHGNVRSVIHKDYWERDMDLVGYLFPCLKNH